jgi:hypothetical protein
LPGNDLYIVEGIFFIVLFTPSWGCGWVSIIGGFTPPLFLFLDWGLLGLWLLVRVMPII